jgi:putative selenate reductase
MQCSTVCDKCVEVCPNRANLAYLVAPVSWSLPVLACQEGAGELQFGKAKAGLTVIGREAFQVSQGRQILHIDDFCNECGNCETFCVHQGQPYAEKPRLFLHKQDWQSADHQPSFYIEGNAIYRREQGQESSLSVDNGSLVFEDDNVQVRLSTAFEVEEMALKRPFEGALSLRGAAEMSVILDGVLASTPFLVR